jgi:hypothetical protein
VVVGIVSSPQTAGLARNPPCDINNCTSTLAELLAFQNEFTLIYPPGVMVRVAHRWLSPFDRVSVAVQPAVVLPTVLCLPHAAADVVRSASSVWHFTAAPG